MCACMLARPRVAGQQGEGFVRDLQTDRALASCFYRDKRLPSGKPFVALGTACESVDVVKKVWGDASRASNAIGVNQRPAKPSPSVGRCRHA